MDKNLKGQSLELEDLDVSKIALQFEISEYKNTIKMLKDIIQETLWMARRYADGRSTYAPAVVNECIMRASELGIDLSGPTDPPYASDGTLGEWNPETRRFEKE